MVTPEEGKLSSLTVFNANNTESQLNYLHYKLRAERNNALKAAIEFAINVRHPSEALLSAKKKYEGCKEALDFVEFLQQKLPGWESAVKKE